MHALSSLRLPPAWRASLHLAALATVLFSGIAFAIHPGDAPLRVGVAGFVVLAIVPRPDGEG